jgi:heme/copper-type cytochrome/quinol oxidase subunit 2
MQSTRAACLTALMLVAAACGDDGTTTTTAASSTTFPSTTVPGSSLPPETTTTAAPTTTTADSAVDIAIDVVGSSVEVRVEGVTTSGRIQLELGTEVRLTVAGDVTDEIHLHGYDLTAEVAAGEPAVIEFTADIPGIFEVELEGSHRLLAEIQVW